MMNKERLYTVSVGIETTGRPVSLAARFEDLRAPRGDPCAPGGGGG